MRQVLNAGLVALALAGCSPALPTAQTTTAPVAASPDALAKEAQNDAARKKAEALIGKPIPPFRLQLAGGGSLSEADLKGKWTIVEFWGIWCPDCMIDAPHVAALATAVQQDPGLRFIGVHVDTRTGRWSSVAEYLQEKGLTHPNLLDPERTLYKALALGWVPTYLVVDPQGVVRATRRELHRETAPEGGVKALLQTIAALRAAPAPG
jgi:peroxiredoxin